MMNTSVMRAPLSHMRYTNISIHLYIYTSTILFQNDPPRLSFVFIFLSIDFDSSRERERERERERDVERLDEFIDASSSKDKMLSYYKNLRSGIVWKSET